jgi:hypothetical protein
MTRLITVALCLVVGALAATSAQETSRPFVVVVEGFAGPMPTADPCVLANNEHGTGHATHLGAMTWTSQETVNLCAGPDGAEVTGQIVITAADGDQLTASYDTIAVLDFGANQVTALGQFVSMSGRISY